MAAEGGFRLRLHEARLYRRRMRLRFPFRFGAASLTDVSVLYVRLDLASASGASFEGVSASILSPMWFDKRPGRSLEVKESDLLQSVRAAADAYAAGGLGTPWDLHQESFPALHQQLVERGMTPLAAGFGASMIDAAVVDGTCRFLRRPFCSSLREGLGVPQEDAVHLPERPREKMLLRHTVGLGDALCDADLESPLNDGLPETLEQVLEAQRPQLFKIKIGAQTGEMLMRLRRIAQVLDSRAGSYSVTLDGNEQFSDLETFGSFIDSLRNDPQLETFAARTLWIEQPVTRERALDPEAASQLARVTRFKPVIIDESDDSESSLAQALKLGYAGVSSKLGKGVFRSIAHYLLLRKARASARQELIFSSEDLTAVPVHSLQQDLCLAASLGMTHSERNGHHYIRAFDFMPGTERDDALMRYPSLYETDARGNARVRIADAALHLAEVNTAHGFGVVGSPNWDSLEALS